MKLRILEQTDAEYMLEWMHTPNVVRDLQGDFFNKTLDECRSFIKSTQGDTSNIHLAIVDEQNEYMGTVSLKNIRNSMAEFAIVVRECAMGKGYATYAIKEIIRRGFEEYKLHKIYWCVSPKNTRAVAVYKKHGYKEIGLDGMAIAGYSNQQIESYLWFGVER